MTVFISHAQEDEYLAVNMAFALQKEGLQVWLANREILPGDNWGERVAEGLRNADAMVVLLTERAIASSQVRSEIEFALGNKDYSWRVVPVIVGHPAESKLHSLPWIIKRLKTVQMDSPDELDVAARRVSESLLAAA